MNKGKRGGGKRALTPSQLVRAMEAFGPTLEKYELNQYVFEPL